MALVMFDYDGVIVDSLSQFTLDFIAACRENGLAGLASQEDALALFADNVYESLAERGLDAGTIERIMCSYALRAKEHLEEVKLFSGMAEALEKIARENTIYIITSNVSAVPERVLALHGLTCVEEVLGADKEKSKVRKILQTMQRYPHLTAYYVGDTEGDMVEGKEAGALTVGVAWGWAGAPKLLATRPDYLIYSPVELVKVFENTGA